MRLWGSRFDSEPDKAVTAFTSSIEYDRRLAEYDVKGSIAHARMLAATGIIGPEEAEALVGGLQEISQGLSDGSLSVADSDEDIHTAIERLLSERIGPVAGKLHTARSRNDQVVTDLRLFVKDAAVRVLTEISGLQKNILDLASKNIDVIAPGMTHMQTAQPILLAHHLMAYFWMLERDWRRWRCCYNHADWSPLGSAALAGTGFPIDRRMTADELGFANVIANSIDAVSDRDFVILFQAMASILIMHLSRLSEELIIWSGPVFGFIEIDDAFATGSSIMPQKKNPDVAELIRGKTGRIYGHLQAALTMMKGLPLSYNRDMQEDKEGLFDTVDTLIAAIPALAGMIATLKIDKARLESEAGKSFSTATDLADYLTAKGMPFREAHEITGQIVRYCLDNGIDDLARIELTRLSDYSDLFEDDVYNTLTVKGSVASRKSYGGTAPEAVKHQIEEAKNVIAKQTEWHQSEGA